MSHRLVVPVDIDLEDEGDFIRLVGFASEAIVSIQREGSTLIVELANEMDEEVIISKIHRMIKHRHPPSSARVIYMTGSEKKSFVTTFPESLVKNYGNGLLGLKGDALVLLNYFDTQFRLMAAELSPYEAQYPTLLPLAAMDKTGYLRTSPQYSMFACHPKEDVDVLTSLSKEVGGQHAKEMLHEPQLVLSPAACFHCYMDLEGGQLERPSTFTFKQNVFRHEGRMNWEGFGRLRDYHVRELVFIGDGQFITGNRQIVLEKAKRFAERLGLTARVSVTSDPFVVPAMQKFREVQLAEESKLELQLAYNVGQYIAAASFNIHGSAFTAPFQISVKDIAAPVTGCIGFGLERWVLAFIAQHGTNASEWKRVLGDGV